MPSAARDFVREAAGRPETSISPVFLGALGGEPRILVARPVQAGGERLVLALALSNARLRAMLEEQRPDPAWSAAVLDGGLRVVARSPQEERFIGHPAMPAVAAMLRDTESGLLHGVRTMDGTLGIVGAARAPRSGFAVALAAPSDTYWAAGLRLVGPPLLAGLALAAAGLVLALSLGRRLTRALAQLGTGPGAPAAGTGIAEVDAAAHQMLRAQQTRDAATGALRLNEERLRLTIESFTGGVYESLPREDRVIRTPGIAAMLGETHDDPHPEWWLGRIHPDDRPVREAARARLAAGEGLVLDGRYRVRHADGHWVSVWDRSVAIRDAEGGFSRIVGTVFDVSAETEALAAKELLAREMDHRVKNSFALVTGLVSAAAAEHPEAADFAAELRERLRALALAHDLSRQGMGGGRAATLRALLARLARPYGEAVAVAGGDIPLPPDQVQPLALVLHEWLTNSVKHGALSVRGGRVRITLDRAAEEAVVDWREEGGPPASPPERRGFGAELVEATIAAQLEGTMREHWSPGGLRLGLRWPLRHEEADASAAE